MALVRGCGHKLKERVRIEIELKNCLTKKMTSHQLRTTEFFLRIWNLTSLAQKITTTNMYTCIYIYIFREHIITK